MALIPSAFVQVRDYVTIENHDSGNKVSLKIYVSSGLVVLVPYAAVWVWDHVPLRATLSTLMTAVTY
jgi:hypothetical protein